MSRSRQAGTVAAACALVVAACAVVAFILTNQTSFHPPGWTPGVDATYRVNVEFEPGQAIVPGQGQAVSVAGVQVGDVRAVDLEGGRAVVRLELKKEHAPIFRDATVLLRPRTPLKDMYVALDPGTRAAGAVPDGGRLSTSATEPDVNYDEFLAGADADTRAYLRILLTSAGQAFGRNAEGEPDPGVVRALRGTYKSFEPLMRDGRTVTTGLAARRRKLKAVVHEFQQLATELGAVDRELSGLISSSQANFQVMAKNDQQIRDSLSLLPGTLSQADRTMAGLARFGTELRPTARALEPFARSLGPALRQARRFLRGSTPVLRDQLQPFARQVQPVTRMLRPAVRGLATSTPRLRRSVRVVNKLMDISAFNPPGREEGFLFWGAWLAHNANSLVTAQDAMGPLPRALVLATCEQLEAVRQIELGNPSLAAVLKLLNLADRTKLCPQVGIPGLSSRSRP